MDERTRRTTDEASPEGRRTVPAPLVESRPSGRRRLIIGLIVLLVFVAGAYFVFRWIYSGAPAAGGRSQQSAAQPVGAATVGRGDIRVVVNALGTVTPIATVTVQTQISGQLMEVAFTVGQTVKKGDFLAQIDARPYEIAKAQAEGQLAHDQGLLAQAQTDLKRYEGL